MKTKLLLLFIILAQSVKGQHDSESYEAGFKILHLVDSSRRYDPSASEGDKLFYRPLDIDLWFPAKEVEEKNRVIFQDLLLLLEERANSYQDQNKYDGLSDELLLYLSSFLELDDPSALKSHQTNSFNVENFIGQKFPLIIYMCGFNGMSYENYYLMEKLAQQGFIVTSISSNGRHPGHMTTNKQDLLEQVYDAEFAIKRLTELPNIDSSRIGVIGYSWGSLAALLFTGSFINGMVSMDGSEVHLYGESAGDDENFEEIREELLRVREQHNAPYLYLESGNKLEDFEPDSIYNLVEHIETEKYYLRFLNARHEDFSCIPFAAGSYKQNEAYQKIVELTLKFFDFILKDGPGFAKKAIAFVNTLQ